MAEIARVRELAKALCLMNIANGTIDLTDETASNLDYICRIFEQEVNCRKANRIKELLTLSRLPRASFDHSGISPGLEWQLTQINAFNYREEHQNILIVGECATGKTTLAAEIGRKAIERNTRVVYVTTEDLLIAAKRKNTNWKKLLKSDLIVLDELFYMTPTNEELTLLYKSVMFLMESRSFIFVTNRMLSDWAKMNTDPHLTETFRKRIMTGTQVIHL